MDVLTPRSLEEALRLKAERPDAVPIDGGTDVMVELNFDRLRPAALLNLNEVAELRGWSRENGTLRLGAGLTYTEAMEEPLAELLPALAEASRTVGSPQIRNRGTIGGNLGTASPAGDALPPLLVEGARGRAGERARHARRRRSTEFLVGPKQNALADDELIVGRARRPTGAPQTFMKVGPRNAMVIAVVSLAAARRTASCARRSARRGRVPRSCARRSKTPSRSRTASRRRRSPIDDVRGTAAYRRHALRVLTRRALDRCLA